VNGPPVDRIPADLEAEAAVLGAVLLSPSIIGKLVGTTGLRVGHFWNLTYGRIFEVMLSLEEEGDPIDPLIVAAECTVRYSDVEPETWRDGVAMLVERVPNLAHVHAYAERVVECFHLREYRRAGQQLVSAASGEDWEALRRVEGELLTGGPAPAFSYDPTQVGELVLDYLNGEHEVFATPWPKLNALVNGGFRRGSLTLISGYTSMGKSVLIDQILEHSALRNGLRAHLYINEMTPVERALRVLSRIADVPFGSLQSDQLGLDQNRRIMDQLGKMPFGITDCAGWTAQDIARDIRARKWDVAGVDIFHKISGGNLTTELDEKSRVLNEVPKASQANCHVLLCAHVSKPQARDGRLVPPNGSNLRGTGSLENDADNLLFVHRDQNESTGRKLTSGIAYFTKVRNGTPGRISVEFDGSHMSFAETVRKTGQNAINDDIEEF
jgi:replicative DNA helicase